MTRLLGTKLVIPPAPPGAVDRADRLLDVLAGGPAVVVVRAPAGSGKTTLLAQAAHRLADRPAPAVGWLSLDERDDDPEGFWAYLRVTVARASRPRTDPPRGSDPRPAPGPGTGPGTFGDDPAGDVIGLLAAAGTPVVVVLDDYHAVTDPRIHRGVARLIDLLPAGVTLVLGSRSTPPLPLSRWRLAGDLAELTVADLAFSAADTARLLREGLGVAVDDDQVAVLVDRTRGWAVGLRVAGLSLQRATDRARFIERFRGNHHELVAYLGSEVLDRLPAQLRDFLLRTAVLEVLTPDACDAVLERTGSAAVLEQLARAGLFHDALDETWSAFGCHPLVRDVLISRLRSEQPEVVPGLHRRAAEWLIGQGQTGPGVAHLLAAGAHQQAHELLVENWVPLSNRGGHGSVWQLLTGLPRGQLDQDPGLCLMAAWTRLNQRDYAGAEAWLRQLDTEDAAEHGPGTAAPHPGHRCEAAAIRCHAQRHLGDVDGALAAGRRAVDAAPAGDDLRLEMAHAALGTALYWAGQSAAAVMHLRTAADHGRRVQEESSVVLALMYQAACLVEDPGAAGGLGDARAGSPDALAREALRLAQGAEGFHVPAIAHLVLAHETLRTGRPRDALAELDEAERLAQLGHEPLQCICVAALRARALHRLGETDHARARLRAAQRLLAAQPDPGIAAQHVHRAVQDLRFAPKLPDRAAFPVQPLTPRELTLLGLLDSDLTREQLAAQLYVSLATVKSHLHSIARKLDVSDRRDIVARARTIGLLPPTTTVSERGE